MWRRHKPKQRRIRVYFDLKVQISQNVYFAKMTNEDKRLTQPPHGRGNKNNGLTSSGALDNPFPTVINEVTLTGHVGL